MLEYIKLIFGFAINSPGINASMCAPRQLLVQRSLRAQTLGITPEELILEVKAEHEADFSDFCIDFDHYSSTHTETNRHLELIYSSVRDAGGITSAKHLTTVRSREAGCFL